MDIDSSASPIPPVVTIVYHPKDALRNTIEKRCKLAPGQKISVSYLERAFQLRVVEECDIEGRNEIGVPFDEHNVSLNSIQLAEDGKFHITGEPANSYTQSEGLFSALSKGNSLISSSIDLLDSLDTSVASVDSCRSRSKSGECATGRHVNRLKYPMKKFRKALIKRDACCVATGEEDLTQLVAAHIVPLEVSQRIRRDQVYSVQNGILLRKDLEQSYDLFQWIFDYDGTVNVMYNHWIHKNTIKKLNLPSDPSTRPSAELIKVHNDLAIERKQHCCPYCWKYVGIANIEEHIKGSCEALNLMGGDSDNDTEPDIEM